MYSNDFNSENVVKKVVPFRLINDSKRSFNLDQRKKELQSILNMVEFKMRKLNKNSRFERLTGLNQKMNAHLKKSLSKIDRLFIKLKKVDQNFYQDVNNEIEKEAYSLLKKVGVMHRFFLEDNKIAC